MPVKSQAISVPAIMTVPGALRCPPPRAPPRPPRDIVGTSRLASWGSKGNYRPAHQMRAEASRLLGGGGRGEDREGSGFKIWSQAVVVARASW